MANEKSTVPVQAGVSFETYCAELGIDLSSARQATLTKSIRDRLRMDQAAFEAQLDNARR
jgi:hypothetical protein